ncbi:hypothetical protein SFUMM280S_00361 [Streptomyces fumanus]
MTSEAVRRVQSGSAWEESFGFSRAVAAGDRVLVAGTTAFKGEVLHGEGDPYEQAKVAFTSALEAIAAYGLGVESVIRTRVYLGARAGHRRGGPGPQGTLRRRTPGHDPPGRAGLHRLPGPGVGGSGSFRGATGGLRS